ncbi:protease SohB [Endozoicomonas sp. Mp262]|uniref:protease SohB n=1 Tax=Endozoicomonas sp. Mp262 TaxID=2919499 RepID=UPI0021DA304E
MEYIAEFALFFAKTITLIGGLLAAVLVVTAVGQKTRKLHKGHLEVTKLNEHFQQLKESLQHALLDKEALKKLSKDEKKKAKKEKGAVTEPKSRVFVIDFHGDIKASGVKSLREEVTAVLSMAQPDDEVVIRLESAGGMVHSYGLASSQLCRIRSKGIRLTIAVDKVAASGGYMMACTGDRIISAPFAVIGSIGVMAQLPNFNKILKKNDVDLELHTAGEFKRTLTVFGENTDKGREKFKQDIEDTHGLFKNFIKDYRGKVDIEKVATGEVWYGQKAVEMKLVDELMTSDEYIGLKAENADVVQVAYVVKKGVADKLGMVAHGAIDTTLLKWWERLNGSRFFSS